MATAAPSTQASQTVTGQGLRMFSLGQRPGKFGSFASHDEEKISAAEGQLREEIRAYGLAEIRKSRHFTQQQVAGQMGVTAARVSQIEHGQVDRTAIRGLAGYVEALGGHLELIANFGDERIVIGLGLSGIPNAQLDRACTVGRQCRLAGRALGGAAANGMLWSALNASRPGTGLSWSGRRARSRRFKCLFRR